MTEAAACVTTEGASVIGKRTRMGEGLLGHPTTGTG